MTTQEALDALRRLVESKAVPCPLTGTGPGSSCTTCGGTGRIPNPKYAPLLAVLRVPCPAQEHYWNCTCQDGFHTRTVFSWPEGAVAGMLMVACGIAGIPFRLNVWECDTPDLEAIAAVTEAVQADGDG